jgi:curved DNA-binding protein CbpA
MAQISFSTEWLKKLSDPYAVLGVSVAADDRRVLKRYRSVAKLLHPDSFSMADPADKQLATQLLAHLVNPAYQKLKQEKVRAETVATLRFQVRHLRRQEEPLANSEVANQLLQMPVQEADTFYEQAIANLTEFQYQAFEHFYETTQRLSELNLVYLHLKMGEPFLREKRTGLVSATATKPVYYTSSAEKPLTENYARRHYLRAQEYMRKSLWTLAVQELRDAIRIEVGRSEYYSLLAEAYLKQNLLGMAKVYFRQALKLNPQDPLALAYAAKLNIQSTTQNSEVRNQVKQPTQDTSKRGGLFGLFGVKKH